MSSAPETPVESASAEGRTFVLLAAGAGFAAWEVGFDLGAFNTIDHRRFWAIWILCTVALVAGALFPDPDLAKAWRFRWVLAIPSLWLLSDVAQVGTGQTATSILVVLSVMTFPLALYVIAELLAGDFFRLQRRSQMALVGLVALIAATGWYVGNGNDRFLTCEDFERAGDFQPENCWDPTLVPDDE